MTTSSFTLVGSRPTPHRIAARGWSGTLASLVLAVGLLGSPHARGATVVSNLSESVQGPFTIFRDSIDLYGFLQPFTTGSQASPFLSVTLDFGNITGSPNLQVWLLSDLSFNNVLGYLSGNSSPASPGIFSYSAGSGIMLDAATTYYISVLNSSSGSTVAWQNTASTFETSSAGWTLGDAAYSFYVTDGVGNIAGLAPTTFAGRMSIDVVPEPAPATLLLAGLAGLATRRRR